MTDMRAEHDPARLSRLLALLVRHLDDEEAWLRTARERFGDIQHALAAYDLDRVAELLGTHREDEEAAALMRERRDALRNALAESLGVSQQEASLSRILPRLAAADQKLLRTRQTDLLRLSREVAAMQAATQRLILQLHRISQGFLSQVFGGSAEGTRYDSDGSLARDGLGSLVEVRT